MIYLDYSATTPILNEVLDSYNKASKDYIGNPNSLHRLGTISHELMDSATKQVADILGIKTSEIIYTSGATEANNLALKGVALEYENRGMHIIISKLEHPSVYGICDYLESIGFEITILNNDIDGLIDIEQLRQSIRPDTILVSIVGVNSEMGIRQPLKTINQVIKKANPNTLFHSDLTQAIGKVPVNLSDVDMASFSGHKIYGPKGIGMLYKSDNINLMPVLNGSEKKEDLRPGTPPLALIVAFSKALRISIESLSTKEIHVKTLNDKIVETLGEYENILINKTKYCINHILNFSFLNIRPETIVHALEEFDIYVGTNSACSSGDISQTVLSVYDDRKRALSTIRISLSYKTTLNEVDKFLTYFEIVYKKLNDLYSKKS